VESKKNKERVVFSFVPEKAKTQQRRDVIA